ncbi:hypothetical protein CYD30_28765 [Kosakonia cowanii]|nr:hypothetical protein CYD30_28765 [Kosakonia cowanii]
MSFNNPPFDRANLDNRIAALEMMVSLIVKSLNNSDLTALAHLADAELDRIKTEIDPGRYPDMAQVLHYCYLQDVLPERMPGLED